MDKQQQSICPIDHDHGSQGWAAYLDLVLHMFFDEESTDIRPFPGDSYVHLCRRSAAPKSSTKWCTGTRSNFLATNCIMSAHRLNAHTDADTPKHSAEWHHNVGPAGVKSTL